MKKYYSDLIFVIQKNPGAIRHPEDDKGQELHQKDLFLDINRAHILSPHIFSMCQDAQDSTYTRDVDLQMLSKGSICICV